MFPIWPTKTMSMVQVILVVETITLGHSRFVSITVVAEVVVARWVDVAAGIDVAAGVDVAAGADVAAGVDIVVGVVALMKGWCQNKG